MPNISVIVPVYNVEKYLERCLKSLLNQTFKDIEIICVNDGSTDNSLQILEKFNGIKIINQQNSGLSVARNTGLKSATGEFVAFVDSDDFIDPDFYEKLYAKCIQYNADVACAGIIRENNKKKNILVEYKDESFSTTIKEKFEIAKCPQYNFVWNKLYRKSFLIDNHITFVPGMIYEDMWFTPEILEKSNGLVCVGETFYHYWKHKDTLIKGNSDKSRADKILGHEFLSEKCKKYNVNFNKKEELVYKEDLLLWGIPLLRKKVYRATEKIFLFGIIPFIEKRKQS